MGEVSSRICSLIFESLEARGVDGESLLSGLSTTRAELTDPRRRVSWDAFTDLIDAAASHVGGAEGLAAVGADHIASPSFDFVKKIARLFLSSHDLYWMGAHWFGHAMFWNVDDRFEELPDGKLRETLWLLPGFRDSPAFFHLILGALRAAPRQLGQGDARVTMQLSPGRAVYDIQPPPSLTVWARGRRRLAALVGSRAVVEQLRAEQETLKLAYRQLRQAHAELWAVQEEQRAILSSLDRTPVLLLDREGRVLSVYGLDAGPPCGVEWTAGGPVEGRRLADLLPPESAEFVRRYVGYVLETERSYQVEHTLRTPLGEARFEVRFTPIRDRDGGVRAVLIVSRDVSEQRRLQEAVDRADRLASVGTLAAGVAHELNNPLGAILLSAEHALDVERRGGDPAEREECLRDILANTERCTHIVKGVLRFARSESSEKVPCDLNDIVRGTRDLTGQYVDEHLATLELDLDPSLPAILANPLEVEQVVVNLVRNAVEASGEKGHILVATRPGGLGVRLSVADSGPGMSDHDKQRVFDPVFTTRRDEGGTGLGLSVVHGIVTDHRGQVAVERSAAGGTEVVVDLPAADEKEAPPRA